MDKQQGNKDMPKFDDLNDRIIAESSPAPFIQIKTNLDPKNVFENNPYAEKFDALSDEEKENLEQFFNQK